MPSAKSAAHRLERARLVGHGDGLAFLQGRPGLGAAVHVPDGDAHFRSVDGLDAPDLFPDDDFRLDGTRFLQSDIEFGWFADVHCVSKLDIVDVQGDEFLGDGATGGVLALERHLFVSRLAKQNARAVRLDFRVVAAKGALASKRHCHC